MTGTMHLAQLNIGRVLHALDDPRMADFMNNLARINALAERSPGFVWRYTDATGNATDTRPYEGDRRMAINMSVWESVEALEKFVWQTVHTRFYARKHEWFETLDGAYFVLWHVPPGHRPSDAPTGVAHESARRSHDRDTRRGSSPVREG